MIGAAVVEGLKDAAYAVDWVCNGSLAARSASETYDLALLDLGLPIVDGLDVLKKAPRGKGASLPVIILTARDGLSDRIRASTSEPTITWSSPSRSGSCWHASGRPAARSKGAPGVLDERGSSDLTRRRA